MYILQPKLKLIFDLVIYLSTNHYYYDLETGEKNKNCTKKKSRVSSVDIVTGYGLYGISMISGR